MIDPVLSAAVMAYVGVPGRLDSWSPEQRVVEAVGDRGLDLIPIVRVIVDGVYDADPPLYNQHSVMEMAKAVEGFLMARHPELSGDAVRAVSNQFAFDWK